MERKPALSCIVSAYRQPEHLWICLASLRVQREVSPLWPKLAQHVNIPVEIIVTDDSRMDEVKGVSLHYDAKYVPTDCQCCYTAAEIGAKEATSPWLCFPSHDNWYVPEFADRMLKKAEDDNLDMVYCDILHDPRYTGVYEVVETKPEPHHFDKGGFIIKKELFYKYGFEGKCSGKRTVADGILAANMAKYHKIGKLNEVLWYHG